MLPYMVIGVPHWSGNTWQGNTVYIYQISELFWQFIRYHYTTYINIKTNGALRGAILRTDSVHLKSS